MKLNAKTALLSPKVLLVPYEPHHVPTYHAWMQDQDLLAATASERLSLAQEHEMQASWRADGDKLTFISCLPPPSGPPSTAGAIVADREDSDENMLGDVNAFLYALPESPEKVVAEVEVMIARRKFRGSGYGRGTVELFLWYVRRFRTEIVGVGRELVGFRVKIGEGNAGSIGLFQRLGFRRVGGVNYFGEVEMEMSVDEGTNGDGDGEAGWRILGYENQ